MTYKKLLEFIELMSSEQQEMEVVVIVGSAEYYFFPTMFVTVNEDTEEEGFHINQPLLG